MYSERIFPYLTLIRIPYFSLEGRENAFVNIYLIIDKELVLIDTGPWRKNPADILSSSLAQLGFSIKDISKIIYTHAHPDHMGGGVQFEKEGDFSHSIYCKAQKYVEQYGQYVSLLKSTCKETFFEHLYLYPEKKESYSAVIDTFWHPTFGEIKIDHGLHDGEIIDTGKLKFEVIFTPGHSPWDISLWEEKRAILFSGDFLMEKSTTLTGGLKGFGSDLNSYESSLRKIEKYLVKARYIFPSHGSPIEHGSELAKDILGIVKRREGKILRELSTKKCSLVDLAALFPLNYNPVVFVRQLGVILTHIEKLEKEDKILRLRDSREILFAIK